MLLFSESSSCRCVRYTWAPNKPHKDRPLAADALKKADVTGRLVERTAPHVPKTGTAPSLVVDPGWPKPLPHTGLSVTSAECSLIVTTNIWITIAPRALVSTDAGALGVAGKDAKGNPISALGHPRPYGQLAGCCVPAPSVLEFDKQGTCCKPGVVRPTPGFLEKKCREQDGCFWPSREHGIYVDQNDFVYIAGNGQAVNFHGQFPWAPNFGNDSQVLKLKMDGHLRYQSAKPEQRGPTATTRTVASMARRSRICRPI